MPQDEFLFSVTGDNLVKLDYIGRRELDILPNAHLEKGGILLYFLDCQTEKTGKTWYSRDTGSKIVVYTKNSHEEEFHCVKYSYEAKDYPIGSFYADMSEYENSDLISYYEVI